MVSCNYKYPTQYLRRNFDLCIKTTTRLKSYRYSLPSLQKYYVNVLNTISDIELVALIKQGDHTAFTEVYNRYWKFLYTSAYNATGEQQESMDLCQSIFIWIWENRQQLNIRSSLQAYLHTALKYKIANLIRNGRVHAARIAELLQTTVASPEIDPLEVKELKHFIDQLIAGLPDKCRQAFLLSREEQLSHREIAERLGISEKTVDDHISRALKRLKAPLNRLAYLWLL